MRTAGGLRPAFVRGLLAIATALALILGGGQAWGQAGAEAQPVRPGAALLRGPDLAANTGRARGPGTAMASGSSLCSAMRRRLRRDAGAAGLFVMNAETGKVVCRSRPHKRRILASNMKLFTTAAVIGGLGPAERLETELWRTGEIDRSGVLHGSLYLVGGGDPVLSSPGFAGRHLGSLSTNLFELVRGARKAGIERVKGALFGDATVFDRLRGVADSGYGTSPYIGPLSGLAFNLGYADLRASRFSSDPGRLATRKLARAMERKGIEIAGGTGLRERQEQDYHRKVFTLRSPEVERIVDLTNVYSINFFAEMLIKVLGARFRKTGTTLAGSTVVERFARSLGSGVHAVDGSGLSRGNRAAPAEIGRLLRAMRDSENGPTFVRSLAVAGREGTVADRMQGTAADGRCRAKTGTITGVSALSGYCFNRSGKVMVFSILMNRVFDLYGARFQQDRIAALVARY